MSNEEPGLMIDGTPIRRGTSIFHRNVNRVLWFDGIEDGYVKLGSVQGMIEIDLDTFRQHILNGTIRIETEQAED